MNQLGVISLAGISQNRDTLGLELLAKRKGNKCRQISI